MDEKITAKVELTEDEAFALLECIRVLGRDLGAVRPDYRVAVHTAAYKLGDAYRETLFERRAREFDALVG